MKTWITIIATLFAMSAYAQNFNLTHPEMKEGEVWVGNIPAQLRPVAGQLVPCDSLSYNCGITANLTEYEIHAGLEKPEDRISLRQGYIAYDSQGNKIPDWVPVFAKKAELDAKGIAPESLALYETK